MRSRVVLILSVIALATCARSVHAQSAPLSASAATIACAPSLSLEPPSAEGLRIVGNQDTALRLLFGPQELVVISGGAQAGVQLGQQFFIRRLYAFGRPYNPQWHSVHTAGRLRIVAVNDTTSIAQVETVCDGVQAGDYLEPFVAPVEPAVDANAGGLATLDFSSLSRVMFGDEERHLGGAGDLMLLEYGAAGVAPGTRVAVYRDLQRPGLPLVSVGEGLIVSVVNGTPLMRITAARDAVVSGDYVVPRK